MYRWFFLVFLVVLCGCGSEGVSPEDQFLSDVMALTNIGKVDVRDADGAIVGVDVSVDVINTAPVAIESPFVMTWWMRLSNGDLLAKTTHRFSGAPFRANEQRRVHLMLRFPARMDLTGVQDAATFEFEKTISSAAMAGAGVFLMSSGGP